MSVIKREDFWIEVWEKAVKTKPNETKEDRIERLTKVWNNRADSFAKNTKKEKNQGRRQAVFEFLDFCKLDLTGMNILDLGCGPGNYTIPLAEKAYHVWALDPAKSMLDILEERAAKEGVTNITIINQAWEKMNLEKIKWLKKFDLVFASMTPAVNDKETLTKVIKASKKYCFMSKFAGRRKNVLQEKLWRKLFGEEWDDRSNDIIYPFNLLYSMGYFPNLKFLTSNWVNEDTVDETVEKLMGWLSGYTEITPDIINRVREFVSQEAINGIVREEVETNIGMMVWTV